MTIIYIDTDTEMQNRVSEMFKHSHSVFLFSELYEAYKWIKKNEIPDMIVTEIDIESSMGLQALKFLASKSKLKATNLIGYVSNLNPEYKSLAISEGADEIFSKNVLIENLSSYLKFIEKKKDTEKRLLVSTSGNTTTATKVKKGSALKAIIKSRTKK